jgi:hypothetical protein
MLAVVAPLSSWVPSALALCLLSAAVLLMVLGLLSYLSECYYPARPTILIELVAPSSLDTTEDPYTHFGHATAQRRQSHTSASSVSTQSLRVSSAETRRHGMQWAVCAVAGVLIVGLLGAGAIDLLSSLGAYSASAKQRMLTFSLFSAVAKLSYATLMAIAAAVTLLACALPLVLLRFGVRLRKQADGKIARTEASAARISTSHGACTPSAYTEQGPTSDLLYQAPPSASRLRQLLLPRTLRRSLRRSEVVRSAGGHSNHAARAAPALVEQASEARRLSPERPLTPETRRSASMMRTLGPQAQRHLVRTPDVALAPWGRRARQHSHDPHEAERRQLRDAENEQHRRKLEELHRQYY